MLKEIKTFLAVVRYGTFAAAGTRLGLTQSAVSAQIQRLEEALGAPLFDRTGRSAALNAAGEEAKAMAQHIVDTFHEMSQRVTSRELRGSLRLGAIQTVQASLLPNALQRLHSKHPQISLRLVQGSSLNLMAQVDSGEIDAALMVLSPFSLPSELFWQPLLKEPFVLAVPATDSREDWRELLSTYPVIRYERTSFGGRVVEKFLKRHMVEIHASIEMEDVEGMVKMVASGLGIALVPQSRPGFLPPNVRAVSLKEATFYREIGLVFLGSGERAGLVGALRQCLQSAACDMPSAHESLSAPG